MTVLNEPHGDAERLKEIDKLRSKFEETFPTVKLIRKDDSFLLRFLRSKKFDQKKALKNLHHYHEIRSQNPEVFKRVDNPVLINDLLNMGPAIPLSQNAKDGSVVIVTQPWMGLDPDSQHSIDDFFAAMFLTIEKLLDLQEHSQIVGLTLIDNLENIGLKMAIKSSGTGGKLIRQLFQDVMPVRVQRIVVINESTVVDVICNVMNTFLRDKIKDRIKVKGSKASKLSEVMDLKHLPPEIGGNGNSIDPLDWKNFMFAAVYNGN